jgi:hypothetical protein
MYLPIISIDVADMVVSPAWLSASAVPSAPC